MFTQSKQYKGGGQLQEFASALFGGRLGVPPMPDSALIADDPAFQSMNRKESLREWPVVSLLDLDPSSQRKGFGFSKCTSQVSFVKCSRKGGGESKVLKREPVDYFIHKPRHSGLFGTPLLLDHLDHLHT
jgi:hypothetical protein